MDVHVIPLGRERYELYCESPAPVAPGEAGEESGSWFSRLRQRFTYMVREAETRESGGADQGVEGSWWDRVQVRLLAWVAERVAEQRLLWNLRHETGARLVHPGDMTSEQALALVKRMLRRDHDRHRIWLVVNAMLLLLSAVLALVPGPNLVAYYFAFRVVGHWLSMRGAAQGLHRIAWASEASARLGELRAAILLEPSARTRAVEAIGRELGLPYLASFVERLAAR